MITTVLLPRFIEYQGGQEFLKFTLKDYEEEEYGLLMGFSSFCPILNLIFAIGLLYQLCTTKF